VRNFPTLDQVLELLGEVIGSQVDAEATFTDLVMDSLDLLEWAFTIEDRYELELGDELLAIIDHSKPLRELYQDLRASVESHV